MSPLQTIMRDPRIRWNAHDNPAQWAERAAREIAATLHEASLLHPRVRMLLSGGSTPAPVYRALAEIAVDWARIDIGLVDERDVDPRSEASNARLIDETLLEGLRARGWRVSDADYSPIVGPRTLGSRVSENVRKLHFIPLRRSRSTLDADVAEANRNTHVDAQQAVLVLGMGDDGHTASLFPGARNLAAALSSDLAYAAIDAQGCEVAGIYPQRISLTARGIARAASRILLLRGERKLGVLAQALLPGSVHEYPIRAAIEVGGSPLHVHWCRD